uniref:Uncharacterized protein n=1 Tax=Drosophila pseudoobscura pseudoobscura TaxID=46245 RepID=A0A0R3NX96_DROPS
MYVVNDPSFPPGTQRVITTGGGSSVVKKQDSQQQVLSLDKNCKWSYRYMHRCSRHRCIYPCCTRCCCDYPSIWGFC